MATGHTTGFTDLPPELRTMIYELSGCLVLYRCHSECKPGGSCNSGSETALDMPSMNVIKLPINLVEDLVHLRYDGPVRGIQLRPIQPALTRVCKQVREENLPMFYGAMLVRVSGSRSADRVEVCQWLEAIGHENAGMIRNMNLNCGKKMLVKGGWKVSRLLVWDEPWNVYRAFATRLHRLGVRKSAIVGPKGQPFELMMSG